MEALLNVQHMEPHTKSENPLQFDSAHRDVPVVRTMRIRWPCEALLISAQLHT